MTADGGRVRASLAAAGLLDAADAATLEPLRGGWWNAVWRLRAPAVDWVVKAFADGSGSTLFPMLPADEARALETLRGLAIAPDPVAFLPATAADPAILVYAFHPGAPWDGVDPARVGALLRRLHGVRPEPAAFRALATTPAAILAEGDTLLAAAGIAAAGLRATRPARGPSLRPAPPSLLHTDAGPTNLIDGPAGLRIIDWQCPGLGDPAEDLFSFLSPSFQILSGRAPLAPADRGAVLDGYGEAAALARLAALWPALSYRMAAYCSCRQRDLATADPAGAERYGRALAATLDDLRGAAVAS